MPSPKEIIEKSSARHVSRREFVKATGLSGVAATIVPRHVLGGSDYQAPSDTLNVATIGAGGMGTGTMSRLTSENIVAICDVDFEYVMRGLHRNGKVRDDRIALKEAYDKATTYDDFREMLDKEDGIDAVVVATPDHVHATAAATAMRLGKHVYVQKPLTWSVHEARVLRRLAEETGVVTQMGNQGHSTDNARRINEWVQAGAIGVIREVHVWTNRPVWSQGLPRPSSVRTVEDDDWGMNGIYARISKGLAGKYRKPKSLHWDLFLGPAPYVDYHPAYQPFNWRGWVDYGVGALGDMGAHLIDHPYWALGLKYPTTIEATSSKWGAEKMAPWGGDQSNIASYPVATNVHYEFPNRGMAPPVTLHWYDGGLRPQRPAVLPSDVPLEPEGGVIMIGDLGILMHETYGGNPQMYPQSLMKEHEDLPESYERVTTTHEMNWANACKGIGTAVSPFEYAGPLTETMILGIVALRTGQGVKIHWDGDKGEVTNHPAANQYLHREYREGYTL